MDVLEVLGSAASMRWLKPDPVPDELIEKVLWAATRASNPGNSQPWAFVVVRDEATRGDIAAAMKTVYGANLDAIAGEGVSYADDVQRRILTGVRHLIEHFAATPVLIFVCGENVYPPGAPDEAMMLSAAYSAAQNLLVAARALGLGATYTTFHNRVETPIKERLGIPDATRICVTMPLGYPARPFPTLTRKPLDEVVHYDHW
jgi:nitroreductase